jgi:hypothetical protein
MRKVLYTIAGLVLIAILIKLVVLGVFFQKVPVATYGVQQHLFGGSGVEAKDYGVGYHLSFRPLYKWHMLDRRMHVIHFVGKDTAQQQVSNNIRIRKTMNIRTRDNNIAYLDVSVLYSIIPDKAHRIVQDGIQRSYQDRAQSTMEGVLRAELAGLTSEQYQDTDERMTLQVTTKTVLNTALEPFHLKAESILIRGLEFQTEYESKLQDKQLQKQLSKLEEAKLGQFEEEKVTKGMEREIKAAVKISEAEWDKLLQELRSANQVAIAEIDAQTVLYVKSTKAEADRVYTEAESGAVLLLQLEEAKRIEGLTAALSEPGSDYYNAMQAIQGLQFNRIVVNSNRDGALDPLSIEDVLRRLLPQEDARK